MSEVVMAEETTVAAPEEDMEEGELSDDGAP